MIRYCPKITSRISAFGISGTSWPDSGNLRNRSAAERSRWTNMTAAKGASRAIYFRMARRSSRACRAQTTLNPFFIFEFSHELVVVHYISRIGLLQADFDLTQ